MFVDRGQPNVLGSRIGPWVNQPTKAMAAYIIAADRADAQGRANLDEWFKERADEAMVAIDALLAEHGYVHPKGDVQG